MSMFGKPAPRFSEFSEDSSVLPTFPQMAMSPTDMEMDTVLASFCGEGPGGADHALPQVAGLGEKDTGKALEATVCMEHVRAADSLQSVQERLEVVISAEKMQRRAALADITGKVDEQQAAIDKAARQHADMELTISSIKAELRRIGLTQVTNSIQSLRQEMDSLREEVWRQSGISQEMRSKQDEMVQSFQDFGKGIEDITEAVEATEEKMRKEMKQITENLEAADANNSNQILEAMQESSVQLAEKLVKEREGRKTDINSLTNRLDDLCRSVPTSMTWLPRDVENLRTLVDEVRADVTRLELGTAVSGRDTLEDLSGFMTLEAAEHRFEKISTEMTHLASATATLDSTLEGVKGDVVALKEIGDMLLVDLQERAAAAQEELKERPASVQETPASHTRSARGDPGSATVESASNTYYRKRPESDAEEAETMSAHAHVPVPSFSTASESMLVAPVTDSATSEPTTPRMVRRKSPRMGPSDAQKLTKGASQESARGCSRRATSASRRCSRQPRESIGSSSSTHGVTDTSSRGHTPQSNAGAAHSAPNSLAGSANVYAPARAPAPVAISVCAPSRLARSAMRTSTAHSPEPVRTRVQSPDPRSREARGPVWAHCSFVAPAPGGSMPGHAQGASYVAAPTAVQATPAIIQRLPVAGSMVAPPMSHFPGGVGSMGSMVQTYR